MAGACSAQAGPPLVEEPEFTDTANMLPVDEVPLWGHDRNSQGAGQRPLPETLVETATPPLGGRSFTAAWKWHELQEELDSRLSMKALALLSREPS